VAAARRYDEATVEFHGFTASRRNYDVGQGVGADGRPRSGVLESSWRMGGASSAELAALTAFARTLRWKSFAPPTWRNTAKTGELP